MVAASKTKTTKPASKATLWISEHSARLALGENYWYADPSKRSALFTETLVSCFQVAAEVVKATHATRKSWSTPHVTDLDIHLEGSEGCGEAAAKLLLDAAKAVGLELDLTTKRGGR